MASIQHRSWITLQHIWKSTGTQAEYSALHFDLFQYKQINTLSALCLKMCLERKGGFPSWIQYIWQLSFPLPKPQPEQRWCQMHVCVLCVKELSLCTPHLKIDVDSTQKIMLMTNICFHNLLCIIADKLWRLHIFKVFGNFFITYMFVHNLLNLTFTEKAGERKWKIQGKKYGIEVR